MSDNTSNNKRIAKNTIFLFMRMAVLMLISLFTSRVVLNILGEENYGIYNVIGGFVMMFSILSGALSAAISRFITFELGKNDISRLNAIFSTSINVQFLISLVIFVLCEVAGIWFINYKMNIPDGRTIAAMWVLQFSLMSFVVGLISVPFNATIIAHEKMNAFAYISIVEAVLKLAIVFLLVISDFDKLIFYSFLLFVVSCIVSLIYGYYCFKNFAESHFHFLLDKPLFKEILGFAGWTFLGNGAGIINTQGVNLLVNLFFGVHVNAARGVATQVQGIVQQFTNNFMTSITPQITKSYAAEELQYTRALVYRSTKFSYYLFLIIAMPIFFEVDLLLKLWLVNTPQYTNLFVRWILPTIAVILIGSPLQKVNAATGKVKKYQITITLWGLLVLPLSYVCFKFGRGPEWGYIIYFIIYFCLIFRRIYLVKDQIEMKPSEYYKEALVPVLLTTLAAVIVPLLLFYLYPESIFRLILMIVVCIISSVASIYIVGLKNNEREFIINVIKSKFSK